MSRKYTILYIHGMGGGVDSRIPSILNEHINEYVHDPDIRIDIVVRTYDIDPYIAERQISSWREELRPQLVIGESLGSLHAILQRGVPHLFVSPAIGAARWMAAASWMPGASWVMHRIFKPVPGERQVLDFSHKVLSHYRGMWRKLLACTTLHGSKDYFFAFFGTEDRYMKSGIVNVRKWAGLFGSDSYATYKGTHYMEEEYLHSMLIPKILEVLGLR
ncbi:MAG: hypothetical protein PUB47_04870 [Bacteroides sp.]|nr:hypothetical protein [Bacteroidales bacterium]MDD6149982.1 hypothetical protein [Bacteroides sp.]